MFEPKHGPPKEHRAWVGFYFAIEVICRMIFFYTKISRQFPQFSTSFPAVGLQQNHAEPEFTWSKSEFRWGSLAHFRGRPWRSALSEDLIEIHGILWILPLSHSWLVVWNIFFSHILDMSSSQLTHIFQRGSNRQPGP